MNDPLRVSASHSVAQAKRDPPNGQVSLRLAPTCPLWCWSCIWTVRPHSSRSFFRAWDSDMIAAPGLHTACALRVCQLTKNSALASTRGQISSPVNGQDGGVQSWYQNAGMRIHVFVRIRGPPFLSSSLSLGSVLIIFLLVD